MRPSGSLKLFLRLTYLDAKLVKIYYGPEGYWKGIATIKKLAEAAKVPEEAAKKWLIRQALWQIFLPVPKRILPLKFDVPTLNKVHQADLLFLPHDKLPRGRKVLKYTLTVVDMASRYKEAKPLTSKNSDEVAQAFQKIYKRGPLEWPEMLQVDPGRCHKRSVYARPSTPYSRPVGKREKILPSLVQVRYLYQPGELERGVKRATDPIWSLKVYSIERSFSKPDQPVLYYLRDGPKRGFVREELLVVPPNTQLPPEQL